MWFWMTQMTSDHRRHNYNFILSEKLTLSTLCFLSIFFKITLLMDLFRFSFHFCVFMCVCVVAFRLWICQNDGWMNSTPKKNSLNINISFHLRVFASTKKRINYRNEETKQKRKKLVLRRFYIVIQSRMFYGVFLLFLTDVWCVCCYCYCGCCCCYSYCCRHNCLFKRNILCLCSFDLCFSFLFFFSAADSDICSVWFVQKRCTRVIII